MEQKTELAIATDYQGESKCLEEMEQTIKNIAEAGFTHLHWCHEWDGDYTYAECEMEQIKAWMDKYQLKAKGVHATKGTRRPIDRRDKHYRRDYTSDWEVSRKAGVELIKNRVDLAACIGAEEIVLHLYVPFRSIEEGGLERNRFYADVERSLDELMPYCMEKSVRICIENLFDMPKEYMTEAWDWILKKYPPEYMGFCLDTGHANMLWHGRLPEIIRRYGERIYSVHLHDNFGEQDSHLHPGEGNIPWEEVMAAFRETSYELPLILEVGGCKGDVKAYLQKAYEAGTWLQKLYERGE